MRIRRTLTVGAFLLAAAVPLSTTATAATITTYLSWGSTVGSCTGETYKSRGNRNFDPALHSRTYELSATANGNTLIGHYSQDGVRTATYYFGCKGGSVKTFYNPVVYNNRRITKSWQCYGASCVPLPTIYGSWKSGTGPKG